MAVVTKNPVKLSLLQMVKSVVFCAVAFACIAPMLRLWQVGAVAGGTAEGLVAVMILEGIIVPLVWIGLSMILIRGGPWRDALVVALLLCSVLVALGFACWLLFHITIPQFGNANDPLDKRIGFSTLGLHLMIILTLAAGASFLSIQWWRSRTARKTFSASPSPDKTVQA